MGHIFFSAGGRSRNRAAKEIITYVRSWSINTHLFLLVIFYSLSLFGSVLLNGGMEKTLRYNITIRPEIR